MLLFVNKYILGIYIFGYSTQQSTRKCYYSQYVFNNENAVNLIKKYTETILMLTIARYETIYL